jgi:hypothetical protein
MKREYILTQPATLISVPTLSREKHSPCCHIDGILITAKNMLSRNKTLAFEFTHSQSEFSCVVVCFPPELCLMLSGFIVYTRNKVYVFDARARDTF